jgi:ATP-binding cassette subfamily B protein/subfamily B ATP-binding cassette protein MsbA
MSEEYKDYHEEAALKKVYDRRILKRLLKYTKPQKWLILLAIILMLVITGLELAQPYLIKIAIDDHINGLYTPMVRYEPGEAPLEGTIYNQYEYLRVKRLTTLTGKDIVDSAEISALQHYQIVEKDNRYYLVTGKVAANQQFTVMWQGSTPTVNVDGAQLTATELTADNIKSFRTYDVNALYLIALIFLVLLLLLFVVTYIQQYILQYSGQRIIFSIRQDLFSHIQKLSLSFFDRNPVGRILTRVTNDIETLNTMYTQVLVSLFKDMIVLVGIIIVMLSLNVKLALICFISIPFVLLSTFLYRKYARPAFREVRVRLARINTTLNENISGMRMIHVFKREKQQFKRFDEINSAHYDASMRELKTIAIFRPAMDLIYSFALASLLWFGAQEVLAGWIEFGLLFAFIEYLRRFFQPINDLTEQFTVLQQAMASAERIFQLLDEDSIIAAPEDPAEIENFRGEIEFDHVWFAYNNENWVLKDISFTIEPGEMVAFVGATGAGKTSIINLLGRFYDIQKGAILIDGVDIRDIPLDTLRRNVGIVLQDVFLFSGDIRSNITLNNQNITEQEMRDIAHHVNASTFIEKLPQMYNEEVKERGSTLSQGQRQLLSFARTLAFKPSILVLDEATANIDTETELLIQDALNKLIKGRTTIVIAHRLSTIQHADKIIVLHKGEIREMGNHQELLANEGLYHNLYQLQYQE